MTAPDETIPTDPVKLRNYVIRLRSLFRLWADTKGDKPEEAWRRASVHMRQIRAMLGEPTAGEEIEMLRLEREAAEAENAQPKA